MHLITILLFLILVSLSHHVLSQDSFPFNTSVIPIFKDAKTSIHKFAWSLQLYTYEPYYLIDLDAPFTWTDCVVRPPPMDCGLEFACTWPLRCDDTLCKEAHSPTEDVLSWSGNANMEFDLLPTEDVLPWLGYANMAFDLRPTEDVLPWLGYANMAFDLRSTKDVLPWLGYANMAFDLRPVFYFKKRKGDYKRNKEHKRRVL
ncbi:hypothetical protein Tco_1140689 [Tanacetum coccineum]